MKNNMRKVWVMAENNGNKAGFKIFLSISGQREFLMYHRHNGLLFRLLEHGVRADDLRRWEPFSSFAGMRRKVRRKLSTRMEGMVEHLLEVIDDFMLERECESAAAPVFCGADVEMIYGQEEAA